MQAVRGLSLDECRSMHVGMYNAAFETYHRRDIEAEQLCERGICDGHRDIRVVFTKMQTQSQRYSRE
jgi:hypothetical protein